MSLHFEPHTAAHPTARGTCPVVQGEHQARDSTHREYAQGIAALLFVALVTFDGLGCSAVVSYT